jgi:RES domain
MAKFPQPPGVDALRELSPDTVVLATGKPLARIYFAAGVHPTRWNVFRSFGPTAARWDHHLPEDPGETPRSQRAVFYCAPDVDTCIAEVFQATRRIDRVRDAPWLVTFNLSAAATLLDLRGDFATRLGASTALHSGPRARARAWARVLYEAYPQFQGLYYGSSMNGYAPAIVLNERARDVLPAYPQFHRALNDDSIVEVLQRVAQRLGYGLR